MSVVRMLKCTLVVRQRDADEVLEAVQDAGLMHVSPVAVPDELAGEAAALTEADPYDQETLRVYEELERRRHALLNVAPAPERLQDRATPYDEVLSRVDEIVAERDALAERRASLEARAAALRPWGDFDPADVQALREAGLQVAFAAFQRDDWERFDFTRAAPDGALGWQVSHEEEDGVWVLFVGRDLDELDLPREDLPEERLSELEEELSSVEAQLGAAQRELSRYAHYESLIERHMAALADRVEVLRAKQRGLALGPLLALTGYVPAERSHELQAALQPHALVLRLEDPAPDDDVPTLLKNNFLVRGFESIVRNFSGVSYREKDFTWAVALLFVVFGALCLLDAGYGLLLLATGLVLRQKGNKEFGSVLAVTGVGATAFGLLSGSIFGFVIGVHVLKDLQPPLTLSQVPYHAFLFSLVVGMVVMTFSYATAIWQKGFQTPATGGLLLVLAASTWVASSLAGEYLLTLLYGWQTPPVSLVADVEAWGTRVAAVLGVGALLAFVLFPDPVFGPKARAGNVVWTLYSSGTGLLQDIFSHMRLFGIALSGSIMAFLVNDLGGRLPLPLTILFAVIGHALIFALSLLSLYVHTNRLIFLEYGSKCIDGGHNEYTPLRRRSLA